MYDGVEFFWMEFKSTYANCSRADNLSKNILFSSQIGNEIIRFIFQILNVVMRFIKKVRSVGDSIYNLKFLQNETILYAFLTHQTT